MSTPKIVRAAQNLLQQISRIARNLTKKLVSWLLRGLLVLGREPFASKAGFVLPTVVLLLLVVTLTVGAIGYRTYTRSQQTIGERQQKVIYNAATPAIDRAKAKLEFLFDANRDPRIRPAAPDDWLDSMLHNDGLVAPKHPSTTAGAFQDPYTFPGETRIDLNADGTLDNAWTYPVDVDNDGVATGPNDAKVAYSMVFRAPAGNGIADQRRTALIQRAQSLLVRNAPLSNSSQSNNSCQVVTAGGTTQAVPINADGWFKDPTNSTKLRKTFQVDAYVLPNKPGAPITTLEFQQDRLAIQGFKWAAWFRNDLEIFPGPPFNWNGAMHTEGSVMAGGNFRGYMISSPGSCLYTQDASQLTATQIEANNASGAPAYQGQFMAGVTRDNDYSQSPRFDLWNGSGVAPTQNVTMNGGNDSVRPQGGGAPKPGDVALDPVVLQSRGVSLSRGANVQNGDPRSIRDGNWGNGTFVTSARLINQVQGTPYVDDTFRADNRYGPGPMMKRPPRPIPGTIGQPIVNDTELTGNDPVAGQGDDSVGLDGYWERRARREGLRLIVGQRLELGDPAGWGGPINKNNPNDIDTLLSSEPLRPWQLCPDNSNGTGRCTEARQRKSLWDNLAAVQATAVYHAKSPNGPDFPAACMATTIHPGTADTLDRSSTFEDLALGLANNTIPGYTNGSGKPLISDFFNGRGTNGWEFTPVPISQFTGNTVMIRALRNLSQFAGDPNGGAPSFTPVQDNFVHPFPAMAMWGDFSNLRRVLKLMDTGTAYASLSPADKSTLHSAACTLSLLAYNIDYLNRLNPGNGGTPMTDLKGYLDAIDKGSAAAASSYKTEVAQVFQATGIAFTALQDILIKDRQQSQDPQTYIRILERIRDTKPVSGRDRITAVINLAKLIATAEQVQRDRKFGFGGDYGSTGPFPATLVGLTTPNEKNFPYSDNCEAWRVATDPLFRLCSGRPHYPALYSIFPLFDHGDVSDGTSAASNRTRVRDKEDGQNNFSYLRSANNGLIYSAFTSGEINSMAAQPRTLAGFGTGPAWTLPVVASGSGSTPNSNDLTKGINLIKICPTTATCSDPAAATAQPIQSRTPQVGSLYRVPFKEAALYNGRELMAVRTLDLDIDLMRRNNTSLDSDYWLPLSGLIYAFREDAVSEANIVRPTSGAWASCNTDSTIQSNGTCRMSAGDVSAEQSQDPPLSSDRAITPKPVDYAADPDRRPHGFRIRNGASVLRANDNGRGMSFISHNPVYVQGDFNLHRLIGSNTQLEEFTTPLDTATFSNFYTRPRSALDTDRFSRPAVDEWRPSEVLADAVTVLANNFCDGSIEDGFLTAAGTGLLNGMSARYGCTNNGNVTSYMDQPRASQNPVLPSATTFPGLSTTNGTGLRWMRTNIADSFVNSMPGASAAQLEGQSPIFISRSGDPLKQNFTPYASGSETYDARNGSRSLTSADNGVRQNMIMVSGIVPSRPSQAYGGLHNFPRFLQSWSGKQLYISGAFLQLNFSTYATAPFDQDAWEPGANPVAGQEYINYYSPPDRRWGYDVGLQYAPAGPVAQRFTFSEPVRSEFYTEPAVNDAYLNTLCKAITANAAANCPAP